MSTFRTWPLVFPIAERWQTPLVWQLGLDSTAPAGILYDAMVEAGCPEPLADALAYLARSYVMLTEIRAVAVIKQADLERVAMRSLAYGSPFRQSWHDVIVYVEGKRIYNGYDLRIQEGPDWDLARMAGDCHHEIEVVGAGDTLRVRRGWIPANERMVYTMGGYNDPDWHRRNALRDWLWPKLTTAAQEAVAVYLMGVVLR